MPPYDFSRRVYTTSKLYSQTYYDDVTRYNPDILQAVKSDTVIQECLRIIDNEQQHPTDSNPLLGYIIAWQSHCTLMKRTWYIYS